MRLAVLITCFNRIGQTEKCITNLIQANECCSLELTVFVTDGGSTDGTVEHLQTNYPFIRVLEKKDAYWNQGMINSWAEAEREFFDGFLLLNDDLHMNNRALLSLEKVIHETGNGVLIIGRTISSVDKKSTYGALIRKDGISKLRFTLRNGSDQFAVTMNGNFAYVPRVVYESLGKLSPKFSHSMGDIDYGLRASKHGFGIIELPEPVAIQEFNSDWALKTKYLTVRNFREVLFHPKGIPIKEHYYFCKTHGGYLWPVNFFARYMYKFMPK